MTEPYLYQEKNQGLSDYEKQLMERLMRKRFPNAEKAYIEQRIASYSDDDHIFIATLPEK
ncbi:hypothetical protein A9Q81_19295 [Gammaproteobacteria bacterium 42_54_T18]|nr:hypothetical protein A9Q81_19295 [Gammaproteobacteria bacterium 42_54_T18]